ncbi:MAG: winged helix-turn-helix domain-containing protein [Chloroflexi bacterium]|nr:winged helix-turn-helix domain-containing protein [Chloroflexota bacterium]
MSGPIRIDRATARRFLVRRHLLAPPRSLTAEPASILRVVERLGSLQFDPLGVAGRNHDVVLLARIDGYRRAWTNDLLYRERSLFEAYNKGLSLLPSSELPYYRLSWDRVRATHEADAFRKHGPLVEELLERIRRDGPLSSTDVAPRAAIEWYWRPTNQVRAILEALAEAGILGLARREGNRRVYDLIERLFPEDLLAERRPEHDQRRHKLLSRYRAHGLLGRSGSAELWLGTAPGIRPNDAGPETATRRELLAELVEMGALVAVDVDGIRGDRFILADEVALLAEVERELAAEPIVEGDGEWTIGRPGGRAAGVALLAPLDPLVWDRDFLRALWDFDYVWEVYVPAARRRWGYYVLPILYGDRLIGRIEPRIDRSAGVLRVLDVWWEAGFEPLADVGFAGALGEALEAHARFADLARIALPRFARHRALSAAIRARLGPGGRLRG